MPRAKKTEEKPQSTLRTRPALTTEARENQLISLAVDLAEQQLRDGTASAQVITHYLKLGTKRERLEQEILEKQSGLITAKTKAYQSADEVKVLYQEALAAMRMYSGMGTDEND